MKSSCMNAAAVGFAIGALATLILATAADAQEPPCKAKFGFRWGQHREGFFAARAGSPCRVTLRMLGRSTISSAEIIERPHSGTALPGVDGTIRFQPNAGFAGKDTMTVRYRGTRQGSGDELRESTVTFSITVF
jgi:hypothetical protein